MLSQSPELRHSSRLSYRVKLRPKKIKTENFPISSSLLWRSRLICCDTYKPASRTSKMQPRRCVGGQSYASCAMSIESSVIHGNEWWSEKQCPVSKNWTNMPFSRSRRSGPLSRRTPAIDSQHPAKYAPLLEKANSVYNSDPKAFLKSATPTPPPVSSQTDSSALHLLSP